MKLYILTLTLLTFGSVDSAHGASRQRLQAKKNARITPQREIIAELGSKKAHVVLAALTQIRELDFSVEEQQALQTLLTNLARSAKSPLVKVTAAETAAHLFT